MSTEEMATIMSGRPLHRFMAYKSQEQPFYSKQAMTQKRRMSGLNFFSTLFESRAESFREVIPPFASLACIIFHDAREFGRRRTFSFLFIYLQEDRVGCRRL